MGHHSEVHFVLFSDTVFNLFVLYLTTLFSDYDYVMSNERAISE
jgi:hypothetical protein